MLAYNIALLDFAHRLNDTPIELLRFGSCTLLHSCGLGGGGGFQKPFPFGTLVDLASDLNRRTKRSPEPLDFINEENIHTCPSIDFNNFQNRIHSADTFSRSYQWLKWSNTCYRGIGRRVGEQGRQSRLATGATESKTSLTTFPFQPSADAHLDFLYSG